MKKILVNLAKIIFNFKKPVVNKYEMDEEDECYWDMQRSNN